MLSADLPSPPRTSNAPRIFLFTSFLVIGMVAAFMLATSHPNAPSSDLMQHHHRRDIWNQWKLHYGKHYHQHEEEHRFGVWNRNFDFVLIHNEEEGHTYRVGLNKFADLERAEFAALYANCLNNVRFNKSGMSATKADLKDLPASVDWRQKNAVTPVKNQQQCGSCWSFSTTGSLEGLHAISEGTLLSFSEQQLVDCSQSYGNQGCNGGLMDDAFKYVAAEGIELESVYPYDAETGKCQYKAADVQFRNADYEDVEQDSSAALQVAVAAHPVSIGIEADTSAFQLYSSGVFNNAGCGTTIDHGVLIVGYGTQDGTPYWIVKNSWGADWGENGYILMERTSEKGAGMCGLAQMASFPTGSKPNPGPNHHEEGEEGNEGGEENNELRNKRRRRH